MSRCLITPVNKEDTHESRTREHVRLKLNVEEILIYSTHRQMGPALSKHTHKHKPVWSGGHGSWNKCAKQQKNEKDMKKEREKDRLTGRQAKRQTANEKERNQDRNRAL